MNCDNDAGARRGPKAISGHEILAQRFDPRSSARSGFTRRDFLKGGLSALAAPMVLGCGGATESTRSGPRLTVQPGVPTINPTLGLTELGIGGGRDGVLYVPTTYSPDTPAPLFVALHGAGGDADNWASYPDRAEQRGMVFMAPDSRENTWDLIESLLGGFGPDVEFLDRALQHTFDRCAIDPNRIALGGFSDGGSYALSLGVSNGDLFTHLLGFAPGFLSSSPPTVGKPKVYIAHGKFDGIIPIDDSRLQTEPILRESDYDVTFEEFDGGHEVPADISESALDWFLDVSSAPDPR